MRIGIYIDGVLTDIENFQIEYGIKYFHNKGKTIVNYNEQCTAYNITRSNSWYDIYDKINGEMK